MARNVYRLAPDGHLWALHVGGRVLGRWRSRDGALRRAQAIADGDQPSVLVVHGPDGSIEYEHSFGHDPHPAGG
jgi:streptogramin lyase